MPYPTANENKQDYIERFVKSDEAQSSFPDLKQRLAVAYSLFRKKHKDYSADDHTLRDVPIFVSHHKDNDVSFDKEDIKRLVENTNNKITENQMNPVMIPGHCSKDGGELECGCLGYVENVRCAEDGDTATVYADLVYAPEFYDKAKHLLNRSCEVVFPHGELRKESLFARQAVAFYRVQQKDGDTQHDG